jgi:hypothetical protein
MHPHPRAQAISDPCCDVAQEVFALADTRQIDEAVEYSARVAGAKVAEFLAAPARRENGSLPWIELVVEFFVPPTVPQNFAIEMDRALIRRSLEYSAARRTEQVAPLRVAPLPPGTFHQWRNAWRIDAKRDKPPHWSADRTTLEAVLRQAQTGWRELLPSV